MQGRLLGRSDLPRRESILPPHFDPKASMLISVCPQSCGADLNCLCTDTITKSFSSCLECAVSLDPSTLSTMQESLNGKYLFPSLTHLVLILVLVPIPIR